MILENQFFFLLNHFENLCLEEFSEDIEFIPANDRKTIMGYNIDRDLLFAFSKTRVFYPSDYIYSLVKTPRLLKQIFRRSYLDWQRLHGEIDFSHLLIGRVLRESAPESFDFLVENIVTIRLAFSNNSSKVAKKDKDNILISLNNEWEKITEKVKWNKNAAYSLVKFLFPEWYKHEDLSTIVLYSPQGFQVSKPTDYWNIFLLGDLGKGVVTDQSVLNSIKDWKERGSEYNVKPSLPEVLSKEGNELFSGKFAYFSMYVYGNAKVFSDEEIRKLSSEVFEIVLEKNGVKSNQNILPSIDSLWRANLEIQSERTVLEAWLKEEIFKSFHVSLRFANDLYYYWRKNSTQDITRGYYSALRDEIISKFRSMFENKPKEYLEILDPQYPASSYHISVLYSQEKEGDDGFTPVEWRWFAELMIDAAWLNPQIMLPQLAPFLVSTNWQITHTNFTIEYERIILLFGNRLEELLLLFLLDIDLSALSQEHIQYIETAKKFAEDIAGQYNRENSDAGLDV
ncbi:MAG: hypothetical protein ACO1RX_03500 [Candidatus Sericytochromatia bacterium]